MIGREGSLRTYPEINIRDAHHPLTHHRNNREFIEGCLLHSNDGLAISLQANGNTVIKNQVGGNTGGTINQTGGNIGPLQNASAAVGTIHPFANFQ